MTWNTGFVWINGMECQCESIEFGDFVFSAMMEALEVEAGDDGLEIFVLAGGTNQWNQW